MKNTREKIPDTAQDLFNENAMVRVSVRSICEVMQIRVSNFTYYFPDKIKIIVELYERMIRLLDALPQQIPFPKESILFLLEWCRRKFSVQNEYRFFSEYF